jgi:hypothetical protein
MLKPARACPGFKLTPSPQRLFYNYPAIDEPKPKPKRYIKFLECSFYVITNQVGKTALRHITCMTDSDRQKACQRSFLYATSNGTLWCIDLKSSVAISVLQRHRFFYSVFPEFTFRPSSIKRKNKFKIMKGCRIFPLFTQ